MTATVTWETTQRTVTWESATAPGVVWQTVVGGAAPSPVPDVRLVPTPLGSPGQVLAVDGAGTGTEFVDQTGGGGGSNLVLDADVGLTFTNRAQWESSRGVLAGFIPLAGVTLWVETTADGQVFKATRNSASAGGPGPWWVEDSPATSAENRNAQLQAPASAVSGAAWVRYVGSPDGGSTWVATSEVPTALAGLQQQADATDAAVTTTNAILAALTTRLNRYYPQSPSAPAVPHLHQSNYVTYDPTGAGVLDGSATHLGGQLLNDGQHVTIANNSLSNGGVVKYNAGSEATAREARWKGRLWAWRDDWFFIQYHSSCRLVEPCPTPDIPRLVHWDRQPWLLETAPHQCAIPLRFALTTASSLSAVISQSRQPQMVRGPSGA